MDTITDLSALGATKGLKIVHLNVRSIIKKVDQLRLYLTDSNIDIVTISESWLKSYAHSNLVSIPGFELLRQDRAAQVKSNKRGGGLLTYMNCKYSSLYEPLNDLDASNEFIEAQWVLIHRPHCKNIVTCNVYRPPKGDLQKAVKYLDDCLKTVNLGKVDMFMLGDFNVNYQNKSSPDYKKLNFFAQSNGLTQHIMNTTRNTDKTKSLIDLALSNSKFVSHSGTLEHFISDHQPIYIIHKKGRDTRQSEEFTGRSYRNYDGEAFKQRLRALDWEGYYKILDPDRAWEFLLEGITAVLAVMCPVRTFKIKNYRPDWMTRELIEQVTDRDYFYRKAKNTGDIDSWNIAKHLRNTSNSNIRQAQKEFILSELKENEDNCKNVWKTIRKVIPSDKTPSCQDILLKNNGVKLGRSEVASHINDYFINVGNLSRPLAPTNSPGPDMLNNSPTPPLSAGVSSTPSPDTSDDACSVTELCPVQLTETEVFKAIKEINISKSSGLDNISSFALKEAFTYLTPEVTYMFNLSLSTSTFPLAWKKATVIPIPKSGDLTQVKNYRPISLLPLPGKILERLVHTQLSGFLEDELLAPEQHGFRKKHSTIHSAAQLITYINSKMDSKLPTLVTYVDFRKAFDCVQHPVLLTKLAQLNLGHSFLGWAESYLTCREQSVYANGCLSTSQRITQGVPQGSVLGPLFYIVYANDLVKSVKHCEVALYADDTILFTGNRDFQKSVCNMQNDITALSDWCNSNGIMANTDKTKTMVFGTSNTLKKVPDFVISFDKVPLQQVSSYKYLGLTLDNQLNYNAHVSKIIASASSKLKQFQRMRGFLSTKASMLVYKSMLLPILEYGDIFLSAATKCNRKKLQTLQNKGLRCALNKGLETSSVALHKEAGVLKLQFRREQHLMNFMFDWSRDPSKLKTKTGKGVTTRLSAKRRLKVKRPKTEKYKKSLAYCGPKKWNALPMDMHQIEVKSSFKTSLTNWVSQKSLNNSQL